MLGDQDLERQGTELWNLCTRLYRNTTEKNLQNASGGSELILYSRVLAYHILHLCQWSTKQPAQMVCHLMRLALKVAKCCIGN